MCHYHDVHGLLRLRKVSIQAVGAWKVCAKESSTKSKGACADDLSSEDGGSPTAVKGLADLKVSDPEQDASKRGG
jgi:hypothetical protein